MSAPAGPPPPDAAIVEYIRANRATYTREAIRQRLLDGGHAPERIDAAWAAIEAGEAREAPPGPVMRTPVDLRRATASVYFWLLLYISAGLTLIILPIVNLLVPGKVIDLIRDTGGNGTGARFVTIGISLGLTALGYLIIAEGGWILMRWDRAAGYGVFVGLAVAFVMTVVLGGLCAVIT